MKLIDLTEGLSPILYHLTSLMSVKNILSKNRFRLTASFSNSSELETGSAKQFFMSTTRSKVGGYTIKSFSNQSVVLVLDGTKLSHNYSGAPVQYWSRKLINNDYLYDEQEDRIYNDKPYIENAIDYIKEAHVLIKPKEQGKYLGLSLLGRKGLLELKKAPFPVYLYDDKKAFITQDTRKAKPLSEFDIPRAKEDDRRSWPHADRRATNKQQSRRDRRAGRKPRMGYDLSRWVELMTVPVSEFENLHYTKKDLLRLISYGHPDPINALSADLQNAKNNPDDIKSIAGIMKKNGLRSAKDVLDFIKHRWEPVLNK